MKIYYGLYATKPKKQKIYTTKQFQKQTKYNKAYITKQNYTTMIQR